MKGEPVTLKRMLEHLEYVSWVMEREAREIEAGRANPPSPERLRTWASIVRGNTDYLRIMISLVRGTGAAAGEAGAFIPFTPVEPAALATGDSNPFSGEPFVPSIQSEGAHELSIRPLSERQ